MPPTRDSHGDEPIFLTVVIPTYNEQERIAGSLRRIQAYLAERQFRSEIIVVDDGSGDRTTEVVRACGPGSCELIETPQNVGKGHAIARGLLEARGQIVLFTDADLSTPIEELEKLLPHLQAGHALVIGSRSAAGAAVERKPLLRRIMSRALQLLVQAFAVPDIRDTQCGFKAYRRDAARRLASLQHIHGFAFDLEHLYLARRLGLAVKEVGVRWAHRDGSHVHPLRDSYRMLRDLLRIRLIHRKLPAASAPAPS